MRILRKFYNSIYFKIAPLLFIAFFIFWFHADFKIKKWGTVSLSANNYLETYIAYNRSRVWEKILNQEKRLPSSFKRLFLETYFNLIPVSQRWSKVYSLKERSGLLLADIYEKNSEFAEAQKILADLVALEQNNFHHVFRLGYFYEMSGNQDQAADYFVQAISLNPNYYFAIERLAFLYYDRQEYLKLVALINSYLETRAISRLCFYWQFDNQFEESRKACSPSIVDGADHQYRQALFGESGWEEERAFKGLRIDPIEGLYPLRLEIKKVSLFSKDLITAEPMSAFSTDNFEDWKKSSGLQSKGEGNLFNIVGGDPNLAYTFPQDFNSSELFYLDVEMRVEKTLNDGLQNIYSISKKKIGLYD